MDAYLLDPLLDSFIREDLEHGDITTDAIFTDKDQSHAYFTAREPLVAAGMAKVAWPVFFKLNPKTTYGRVLQDGKHADKGDVLLEIIGPTRALLRGERVALNLVQRLCGIATLTAAFVAAVDGLDVKIVDTRKTTPGLRIFEKYAVRVGGGSNHRFSLSDGVMIKDNHIAACGSITDAVERVRSQVPHTINVEVETDTMAQVEECLACRVGVIMLDNMDLKTMEEAVKLIDGRAVIEASGGVTLDTVRAIAETGVDVISVGGLTHSAPACDIGMDWC